MLQNVHIVWEFARLTVVATLLRLHRIQKPQPTPSARGGLLVGQPHTPLRYLAEQE